LDALRPWTDQAAVTELLAEWVGDYRGDGSTVGAAAVARELASIGQAAYLAELDALGAASLAFHLLGNVRAGRAVLDYGWPVEVVGPARTVRRWRHDPRYGFQRAMELIQQDLDFSAEQQRRPELRAHTIRRRVQRRQRQ
jgi:hypothetical protein